MSAFAELCASTNFSFLRAGSHPEEMAEQAKALGLAGLGVADRNTLAGVVRTHVAAKEQGLRLIVGARLAFEDGAPELIVYPQESRRLCAAHALAHARKSARAEGRVLAKVCGLSGACAGIGDDSGGGRAPPPPCGEGVGG